MTSAKRLIQVLSELIMLYLTINELAISLDTTTEAIVEESQ